MPFASLRYLGGSISAITHTEAALKTLEDNLDSLICAYVAAHWLYWGNKERNLVLGDGGQAPACANAQLDTLSFQSGY